MWHKARHDTALQYIIFFHSPSQKFDRISMFMGIFHIFFHKIADSIHRNIGWIDAMIKCRKAA